jgi:hypothetical protein
MVLTFVDKLTPAGSVNHAEQALDECCHQSQADKV